MWANCGSKTHHVSEGQHIHRPLRSNRHVAALLSSLWPGLGQLAVGGPGARRSATILALPPLILVALAIGAAVSPHAATRLSILFDPDVIGGLLVIEGLLVVWRLAAVLDAFRRGQGVPRERGAALTAIALLFVLAPSVYAGYLTEVAREAALTVFAPSDQAWTPDINRLPGDRDFGLVPVESVGPSPSAPPELGRFTVLLIGADSGAGREHALTDTMIVASLDPIAGVVSMVSVPRDLVDAPLPDGRTFRPKINELVSYVKSFPDKFPGATSGQAVLAASLGTLLNVRIDGWAQVNLPGFVRVINSIGGVDVTVQSALCDYRYREYGFDGFAINAGHYHLDGLAALAYARIRHSAGESDFTRSARQGEIVVAARDQVLRGGFLNDPAGFISAMGDLVETSFDPSDVTAHIDAVIGIHRDHIFRAVIQYPLVHGAKDDPRGSVLIPRLSLIRDLAARAFPQAGTLPTGLETIPEDSTAPIKTKLPSVSCAAPAPTPTSKPSATPTPTSSLPATETPATPEPSPTDQPGGGHQSPVPSDPPPVSSAQPQ